MMMTTGWRYRQFHISYLLAWFGVGLLAGLLIGRGIEVETSAGIVIIGLFLGIGALRSRRWWAIAMIVIAGVCFGAMRGSAAQAEYNTYEPLVSKTLTISGVMSGDAQRDARGRQKLTLSTIEVAGTHYRGEVFATVYSDSSLKRGDRVTIRGEMRAGFASYAATLSSGKILKIERSGNIIRDVREQFSEAIRAVVMEPMASLGLGFVVGQRSTLPDTLDEQLKVVGLTHIVVASGYNLTILVRFVMRLLARHSRYLALAGSLLMIICFVLFSGFSPSMNRAMVVTVLGLLAWYVGRRFHPVMLILYVSAATALYNPMYVWSDLGWYLSFFAFGGILIVAPLVIRAVYRRRAPSAFEQLVVETMSAEITALPLIAFAFGALPVFGLIANVLVGPFIPAAMALTAATGAIGMVSIAIAQAVAMPVTILIGYMIAVVEWLSSSPVAQYHTELPLWTLLVWYGGLIAGCVYLRAKTDYNFRVRDERLEV